MNKGQKVKIFVYNYNRKTLLGEGTYAGKEKRYVRFCHGVFPEVTRVFEVNGIRISDNDCDWEKI